MDEAEISGEGEYYNNEQIESESESNPELRHIEYERYDEEDENEVRLHNRETQDIETYEQDYSPDPFLNVDSEEEDYECMRPRDKFQLLCTEKIRLEKALEKRDKENEILEESIKFLGKLVEGYNHCIKGGGISIEEHVKKCNQIILDNLKDFKIQTDEDKEPQNNKSLIDQRIDLRRHQVRLQKLQQLVSQKEEEASIAQPEAPPSEETEDLVSLVEKEMMKKKWREQRELQDKSKIASLQEIDKLQKKLTVLDSSEKEIEQKCGLLIQRKREIEAKIKHLAANQHSNQVGETQNDTLSFKAYSYKIASLKNNIEKLKRKLN
ncbi:unnamed protein product [Moneuplotes crassus]|uniref:Uncharacterized protein n=1 Tax=Euplotes crassus TaxID=5936 RepID=A0AAD1UN70_EUPCR|nr:unnamed protein product [Moneuplotes crassus]